MFYKVVKAIISVLVKVLYRPKFENLELIPKNGPIILLEIIFMLLIH